ncbi:hypothetical protein ACJA28_01300 [Mesomycoplasma moatsii]|uniref:hypothetical protein n=1 Tax=Mesomycoplasma moatsii TaxID=171287 RepID=UPI0003B5E847
MKKIALGLGITCLFCMPNLLVVSCSKSKEQSKDPNNHENTKIISVVNSENLNYNNEKVNNMTKIEFLAKIQNNLSKFVIENIKQFVVGDISMIEGLNDLNTEIISNEKDDSNTLSFILKIYKNRWYLDNKIQIVDLSQEVQIINFKQLPSSLDPAGGQLIDKKLSATKYKNIINLFNLKSTMSLIKLNDDYFNLKLQNIDEFKNLKVKVLSGDTGRGNIDISLSGTYKDETINANITISGFNAFNKNEKIEIYNLNINKNAWIENLQPIINSANIDSINVIPSEQWINTFLLNFEISNQEGSKLGLMNELIQQGFNFTIQSSIDKNKKLIYFQISATYTNSEYIGGVWKEKGELINWTQVSYNKPSIAIPTIDDVKRFLINKVVINEIKMQSYYPSYFLGKAYFSKNLLKNNNFSISDLFSNEWTNKINDTYLKENASGIAFGIDCDSVVADDFSNKLEFAVTLAVGGEYQQIFSKHFDFSNKTKNINENSIIANDKINAVSINPDFETNSFLKNLKNILKKDHKNLVDRAFNLQSHDKLSISNLSSTIIPLALKQSLISFEDTEDNVNRRWEQIKKYLIPSIFSREIDLSFGTDNDNNSQRKLNYFSRLYENSFVIESILYKFNDALQLDLINIHQNAIMIKIEFVTEISFNKKTEQYRSQLTTIMLKSQWEK